MAGLSLSHEANLIALCDVFQLSKKSVSMSGDPYVSGRAGRRSIFQCAQQRD
jgi:hypothetical protein